MRNSFGLITITAPKVDPRPMLDKFLRKNKTLKQFIPVISASDLEEKRLNQIKKTEEKVGMGIYRDLGREFDPQKETLHSIIGTKQYNNILIEKLKDMSLDEFYKWQFDYSEFDPKTNTYGYIGDPNALIDWYDVGAEVFVLKNGEKVSKAENKVIDWEEMKKNAHKIAVITAEKFNKQNDLDFIAIKEKVLIRPESFVDKDGKYYTEDGLDRDVDKSLKLYQEAWDKALENAEPEDIFTNWDFRA